jgi:hypothetical protein
MMRHLGALCGIYKRKECQFPEWVSSPDIGGFAEQPSGEFMRKILLSVFHPFAERTHPVTRGIREP